MSYIRLIKKYFPNGTPQKNYSEYVVDCIYCHMELKLSINVYSGLWQCWSCKETGNLNKLLYEIDPQYKRDILEEYRKYARYVVGTGNLKEFIQDKLDGVDITAKVKKESLVMKLPLRTIKTFSKAMVYLNDRGITTDMVRKYNLSICLEGKYSHRIIIPFYENKELVYYLGRSYIRKLPKVLNPKSAEIPFGKSEVLFNYDKIEKGGEVCIVEGVMDAITVSEILPTVALCGKVIGREQKKKLFKKEPKRVFIFLDRDAENEIIKLLKELDGYEFFLFIVNCRGGGDPNELGVKKCRELIKQAVPYGFKTLLKRKLGRK